MGRKSWLSALLCALAISNGGCAILDAVGFVGDSVSHSHRRARSRRLARMSASYYSPQVYRRRLVYFDREGRPMVYRRGSPRYIQPTDAGYYAYVEHYRQNQASYWRWYAAQGYRYR